MIISDVLFHGYNFISSRPKWDGCPDTVQVGTCTFSIKLATNEAIEIILKSWLGDTDDKKCIEGQMKVFTTEYQSPTTSRGPYQ